MSGRRAVSGDHYHAMLQQVGDQLGNSIVMTLRPAVLDRNVLPLEIAYLLKAFTECGEAVGICFGRRCAEKPDHRHGLLRARCERPRRRAAKRYKEFSPTNAGCHVDPPAA